MIWHVNIPFTCSYCIPHYFYIYLGFYLILIILCGLSTSIRTPFHVRFPSCTSFCIPSGLYHSHHTIPLSGWYNRQRIPGHCIWPEVIFFTLIATSKYFVTVVFWLYGLIAGLRENFSSIECFKSTVDRPGYCPWSSHFFPNIVSIRKVSKIAGKKNNLAASVTILDGKKKTMVNFVNHALHHPKLDDLISEFRDPCILSLSQGTL